MVCIFCDKTVHDLSIEHIIPESLGNIYYLLQSGCICRNCNNSFSDFEDKALSKTMLGFERSRLGIVTKKGKAAQALSHNIKFIGDKRFRKNHVTVYGIEEKDIGLIHPDGSFEIKILDFDKSEMATSKLLLKIGLESLFHSRRSFFKTKNFQELKEHLTKINNESWPILTIKSEFSGFVSIPRFEDKRKLNNIGCKILYKEIDESTILLNFRYSVLSYIVNLKSRNVGWAKPFFEADSLTNLYPEHLKKRLEL